MLAILASLAGGLSYTSASASDLPGPVAPEGWGVNIHFTDPAPGEMQRFQAAGFRRARMDFAWARIEKEKGVFDFSAYDHLYAELSQINVVPIFILDYGNDLYQSGSPRNEESRAAFARFAAASAIHFQGKHVVWEIWNEPNIAFWKPVPNADEYAALAVLTAHTIHKAVPSATVIAPGTSGFPYPFFETAFRAGLLKEIDGVSFHPYRGSAPETAEKDFARLRTLIARYAPKGKENLPMISSEWGYSVVNGLSEEKQAAYLSRMWLSNLANGVNLSIFYDWRDDGTDPKENEHNFGTLHHDNTPKASYLAAQTLASALNGYSFRHRLSGATQAEWKLLFQKGDSGDLALATWNTDTNASMAEQTPVVRPVSPESPEYVDLLRLAYIRMPAYSGALVTTPEKPAKIDLVLQNHSGAAANVVATVTDSTAGDTAGASITLRTRDGKEASGSLALPAPALRTEGGTATVALSWNGHALPALAPLEVRRTDPLIVTAYPAGGRVRIEIGNPGDAPFRGEVVLTDSQMPGKALATSVLDVREGTREAGANLPQPEPGKTFSIELRDSKGALAAKIDSLRFEPMASFPSSAGPESGFRQVRFLKNVAQAPASLAAESTAGIPDSPATAALKIAYHFEPMWRYDEVMPAAPLPIPASARALSIWVRSDGSGDSLRCRFRDSTGQTFQPDLGKLDWKGWKALSIPLDGSGSGGHWGGAANGIPTGALSWEGLLLIDSADQKTEHGGEILIAAPTYVFGKG